MKKTISIWTVIVAVIVFATYAVRVKVPISLTSTKQHIRFQKGFKIPDNDQNVTHRHHDLSRVGNQLKLDRATCRPYLINKDALGQPLHDDCPQVFIIGARKGGTTSLVQYLSQHPNFTGANLNMDFHAGETGYFTRYYDNPWEWYKNQFSRNDTILCDSTVGNFVACDVPKKLYQTCSNAEKIKFIALLRDPVERFQSNFRFRVKVGFDGIYSQKSHISNFTIRALKRFNRKKAARGVDKAIEHPEKLLCLFLPSGNVLFEGLYLVHLYNWLCNFPSENFLILNSEEFFQNTAGVLKEVMTFVGLSPMDNEVIKLIVSKIYNANPDLQAEPEHHKLSESEREQLKVFYREFNSELFDLLEWPHSMWN
ncbi:heparan sulfate glucosamine 3-O-sulfotransferase 1-like [Dysidea avara]|uniref:heparan sulfate glucosamine 3-O-sulfotransferase 1-like n=1 Tax=Dysidea avara TaxID=196820 RepID=UPI003329B347